MRDAAAARLRRAAAASARLRRAGGGRPPYPPRVGVKTVPGDRYGSAVIIASRPPYRVWKLTSGGATLMHFLAICVLIPARRAHSGRVGADARHVRLAAGAATRTRPRRPTERPTSIHDVGALGANWTPPRKTPTQLHSRRAETSTVELVRAPGTIVVHTEHTMLVCRSAANAAWRETRAWETRRHDGRSGWCVERITVTSDDPKFGSHSLTHRPP